jgi:hypothetical protein
MHANLYDSIYEVYHFLPTHITSSHFNRGNKTWWLASSSSGPFGPELSSKSQAGSKAQHTDVRGNGVNVFASKETGSIFLGGLACF